MTLVNPAITRRALVGGAGLLLSGCDRPAIDPQVTLATLRHTDSVESFLDRLQYTEQRQAS